MGSVDLTPIGCLINSISRFIHLVTCRVSKTMPAEKDYINVVSILKHLKPALDDITDHNASDNGDLYKGCEELDVAVNEAREFLEKWSPRMSKILCVLRSRPLALQIQISSVELSRLLCNPQSFAHESQNIEVGQLSQLIEEVLKCQKDGNTPDDEHLTEITESLNLQTSQELLNEYISLEKEKQRPKSSEIKDDSDQITQALILISHVRDHMVKLKKFRAPNGITFPPCFRCPLSLELMMDPVTVASGQTYERSSIQKWLDHGLVRCPKTGQNLSHKNLIPNHTVKDLVSNWCKENKVEDMNATLPVDSEKTNRRHYLSSPEHSYVHSRSESASSADCNPTVEIEYTPRPSVEENRDYNPDKLISVMHVEKLVAELRSNSTETQTSAAGEIRLLTKHNMENRVIIGESGALGPLISLLHSKAELAQEHAVTALLNLSINDTIKGRIAEQGALEPLIHVLKNGTPSARENAAASIFSISLLEEYRIKIGRSGAVRALVDLLGNGTIRGKKDAATALFNLSIFHENKARIVQAGAVGHLVGLMEPGGELVDKAVALLANLSTVGEGCSAVAREGAIPLLVEIVESGSQRGKENAASVLLQMCVNSSKYCRSVLQEGAVPPLVALSQSGTPRARDKAQQLLSHFRNQRESGMARGRS